MTTKSSKQVTEPIVAVADNTQAQVQATPLRFVTAASLFDGHDASRRDVNTSSCDSV